MSRGPRRLLVLNIFLVAILLAGAWGAYALLGGGIGGIGIGRSKPTTAARTVAAAVGTVTETVSAAGDLRSSYSANVDFTAAGTVSQILVKVGDTVVKGERLAKLDDTTTRQQVTVANANLASAEQNLTDAVSKNASTAQSHAQVEQSKLALQQARDTLAATVLTAPGNGTVTALTGTVGQKVSGGGASSASSSASGSGTGGSSGFLTITDLSNLVAHANVAEIDISKIKVGQDAAVIVNALPGQRIQAKVSQIDLVPTTSNGVVQYGVSLALTSPPAEIKPGQSTSVQITAAQADNAIYVPSAAVTTAAGQSTVSVLSGGQQVRRPVQVGVRSDSLVQVTSGLSEGDQVVLPGVTTSGGGQGRNGGGFSGGGIPGVAGSGGGRAGGQG